MKDKLVLKKSYTSKPILNKYKNKSIDTITLKDHIYYGGRYYENNIDVKNLEIVYKSLKMYIAHPRFTFFDIKCENVYFKNEENLGGITLSLRHLIRNYITHIDFKWRNNKEKPSNINRLNIITYKEPIKIELIPEELEEINIKLSTDHKISLDIRIKNINSEKIYEIDIDGELKETIVYYTITERDLENGVLDLTKFKDFSVLSLTNIDIDTLKLNKNDIENINKINLYDDVYIKTIKLIDNNDMKLNPITIIPFNDNLGTFNNYIIGDNKETLIYIDSKDNLKIFSKLDILKDKNIEKVEFIKNENDIIIIYKYKKYYKYKIIIDYIYFDIGKLFTLFFKEKKHYMKNYDWIRIMEDYLTANEFIEICNDYMDFKINLRKLLDYGFSYKYFMYLHQRNLDSVILGLCKNPSFLNKYSKEEIKDLNELGKKYVKKLKK